VGGSGRARRRFERAGGRPLLPGAVAPYRLCIYDERAGVPELVVEEDMPPGPQCTPETLPCWSDGPRGYVYEDSSFGRHLPANGPVTRLKLAAIPTTRGRLTLRAKGVNLSTPLLPFAMDDAVTAQLVSSDGKCWSARYSTASKNEPSRFVARSD
jgi:hypothetical protein